VSQVGVWLIFVRLGSKPVNHSVKAQQRQIALSMKIKHLSIQAQDPETAARCLAEMTAGSYQEFPSKTMTGAWVCVWDQDENEMIEFIPPGYKICFGEFAGIYLC